MEHDVILTTIKAVFIALVMNTVGLYSGAIIIAFFASILKLFYYDTDCDKSCISCCIFKNFVKFFGISLPLTLLMVHVCIYYKLDPQLSIIYSSIVAFLGREILDILVVEFPPLVKKAITSKFGIPNDK
jgi:hypothetical protein